MVHIQFYNLKTKEKFEVDDSQVTIVTTKNGRKAAQTEVNGQKFFKFLGKEDLERFESK